MDGQSLRRKVADILIDRIKDETYPSVTMMDRVEAVVADDPDALAEYADVLVAKVEDSRFPSIEMLNRLDRVAAQLG